MSAPLKLNLGAGADRHEGFLSVDLRPDVADILGSVTDLSRFETESVDELLALDILEHFWRDEVPGILAEWRRVLRPGGRLTLRVPNLIVLGRQVADGFEVERSIVNIYGGHKFGPAGVWDTHHFGYTPASLAATLIAAGFGVVSNDGRANMAVVCTKS